MYLHLGQETVIRTDDIVGIFDMDNTTISKWTRRFLNKAEKAGQIVSVTTDIPKTFVVVSPKQQKRQGNRLQRGDMVYLSQISAATLKKRTGYNYR
ncbi:MAG: DUF370 domain-containing protein [Angelakisella sp.]